MWYYSTILPYSKVFKTLEETFAATNFTTKSIHEWTKWPSAIGAQLADSQSRFCSETRTNLTSKLQLTDGLLTDQLTKRFRNRPLLAYKFQWPHLWHHWMSLSDVKRVRNQIIWRQHSITQHQSNSIFFRHNTPDFVSSKEWTPHSTNLNPLHYSVWDTLQQLVCEGRREPFANSILSQTNAMMSPSDSQNQKNRIIVKKKRLAAVAKENGEPIQHFLLIGYWWFDLMWCFGIACVRAAMQMIEQLAKIALWRVTLFSLYHSWYRNVINKNSTHIRWYLVIT